MRDEWQTPQDLFDKLNKEFDFILDAACDSNNCKCFAGFQKDIGLDALIECWTDYTKSSIWMNPPYSKPNLYDFCKKAYEESQKGCVVVGLLPLDCSTKWFKEFVMKADEIRFLSKRVKFINPETRKPGGSPAFSSIIVIWKLCNSFEEMLIKPTISMYEW